MQVKLIWQEIIKNMQMDNQSDGVFDFIEGFILIAMALIRYEWSNFTN